MVHARGLSEAGRVVEEAGLGEAEGELLRLVGRGRDQQGGAVEEVLGALAALVLKLETGLSMVGGAHLKEEADDLEVDSELLVVRHEAAVSSATHFSQLSKPKLAHLSQHHSPRPPIQGNVHQRIRRARPVLLILENTALRAPHHRRLLLAPPRTLPLQHSFEHRLARGAVLPFDAAERAHPRRLPLGLVVVPLLPRAPRASRGELDTGNERAHERAQDAPADHHRHRGRGGEVPPEGDEVGDAGRGDEEGVEEREVGLDALALVTAVS